VDTSWERLLPPLRAVEAMLLHQGPVEERSVTRGLEFIQAARVLGYQAATSIQDLLAEELPAAPAAVLLDPFIDADHGEETTYYLRQMSKAIGLGEATLQDLPDPSTFQKASTYYRVDQAEARV
jgi:hypothetical protein